MALPRLRWIVADEGEPLGALIERLGEGPALAAGRVFVDGARASSAELLLERGARVEIYAERAARLDGEVEVLHRGQGLLWVDKPAGIPTEPDQRGSAHSVVSRVAARLGVSVESLHALSRLDTGVSGVVMIATTPEARQRVTSLRERGEIERRYAAIAHASEPLGRGTWLEPIGRAGTGPRRAVNGREARPAATRFAEVARTSRGAALLALEPVSGRTHQLRVHAAAHRAPLYGDRLYGGPLRVTDAAGRVREIGRIALHAAWVRMPVEGGPELCVASPLAEGLCALWIELGGRAEELELALAASVSME